MIRRRLNRRPSDFWQESSHTSYFITSKSFSHGFRRGVACASLCICVNTLWQFFTILDHCYKQLCRDTSQGVLGAYSKFRAIQKGKLRAIVVSFTVSMHLMIISQSCTCSYSLPDFDFLSNHLICIYGECLSIPADQYRNLFSSIIQCLGPYAY